MAWNEPGSDNRDPWGQGNGQNGPPDLDHLIKDLKKKFSGFLGGGGRKSAGGGGGGGMPSLGGKAWVLILLVLGLLWAASGFYVVEEGEQGVELQFGQYKQVTEAGLRWHVPYPVETVEIVNVQQIRTVEVGYRSNTRSNQFATVPQEALMLTKDENIIDIQFAVQYDIKDPRFLLFNVSENLDQVVRQATESSVREVVGRNTMDFAITGGRAEIAQETRLLLQNILDRYQTGINVKAVEMQNAQPPSEVKGAFDDAVKAREDEVKFRNEAEAYANDIIPRARGSASRVLQEAQAYQASVVAKAQGEASRFTQVLSEYHKAPGVTRDRLYIDAMEQVLSRSTKIMIDQSAGGNNVMYLPLDQLIRQRNDSAGRTDPTRFDDAGGIANSLAETGISRSGRSSRTGRLSE
jgi:membrane protease subunit HflK